MDKKNDLAEKLLKENGLSAEESIDRIVADIQKLIRKEKSRLRQMTWITCGLWAATLLSFYFKIPLLGRLVNSGDQVTPFQIALSFAAQFLPMAAVLSTGLLLFRRYGFSTKQINLRLQIVEARLLKQEKGSDGGP